MRSARLLLIDSTGQGPQPVVMVELAEGTTPEAVDEIMPRVVEAIAARTESAGGLTFAVVTDEWRDAYESGGIVLR